jgi:nitrogen fixation protein FixH
MQRRELRDALSWKLGIALVFAVFLAASLASMITAAHRGSRVVDRNYYQHGLDYDALTGKNAALGWTLKASLLRGELTVAARDRQGRRLAGGTATLLPDQVEGGTSREPVTLVESAPGDFRVTLPAEFAGEVHGTLRFQRRDGTLNQRVVLFN